MATIRVSDIDAARDLPGLLAQVRNGDEVIIESEGKAPAVLKTVMPRGRSISESIARARSHAKKLGYTPTMDADFAADLEDIIRLRRPADRSAWE